MGKIPWGSVAAEFGGGAGTVQLMSRRLGVGAAVVLAVAAAAVAISFDGPRAAPRGRLAAVRARPAAVDRPARVRARPAKVRARGAVAPSLSLDQLAGQRIIYAYSGSEPPPSLLAAIGAGEAAGVIFYGPNITSRAQLKSVIAQLQRANAASPVHAPLLMLVDQEGGEVRRLPGAPVRSEKQIGASRHGVASARGSGAGAAANLAGVGINVNLAPVLDVFRHPGNFIDQYQRSYGSDPRAVALLGAAFISAQQRGGVAATAKHFPGLGAAAQSQNTDLGPVTLALSARQLRSVDELPYRSAIAAGVKLVMTSWAVYPALDARLPAGLSPTVIGGELRRRLGFRGVTITDDIDAGALVRFGSLAQRGVLAARAGADLILCSASNVADNTPAEGVAVREAIASALARGTLGRAAAERSLARIIALRSGL
jgi:beta-N-acetylhexosaminidase